MNHTLLLATRNQKKQKELQELTADLGWTLLTLRDFPDCPEVEEDGRTFLENSQKKAVEVSAHTGVMTLADDSGLEVDALGGSPGVFSARYARGENSTDEENVRFLLLEMRGVSQPDRTGRFVCAATIALDGKVLFATQRDVEGLIAFEPTGENGFGYDPVFYYPPFKKTFAEISAEQKHSVSHRGKALQDVAAFLKDFKS